MDRQFFKRIKYGIEDIPKKEFNAQFLDSRAEEEGVTLIDISAFMSKSSEEIFDFSLSPRQKNSGLGDNLVRQAKEGRNSGFYLNVPAGRKVDRQLFISYELGNSDVLYDQSFIDIEDDASLRLVVYYGNKDALDTDIYRNGLLKIRVGKRASLELIRLQNLNEDSRNIETIRCDAMEYSKFNCHNIEFGAALSATSCSTYMPEEWAEVNILPLYFAHKSDRFDLEQNLIINGKNSLGIVNAVGAMKDKSMKVFRGNVFLNKGCKRSIGRFSNSDILLSKNTKAMSIPTILCDEDDVMGEHAASFEAINRAKLFYLMSRGFTEAGAKKLLVESSFKPIFNKIENEAIRNKLIEQLDNEL